MSKNKTKTSKKPNNELTVEDIYKKKTQHDHILSLPDTYIGSVEPDMKYMWVLNRETNKMEYKQIQLVPGLYKIFDEILVNARDHRERDKTCKNIRVTIDQKNNKITVWNDGNGVPVEWHKDEKMYVPQLIFGSLLTSENYDVKGKTVGGKNGFGAKLTNIFSVVFEVETCDKKSKKKYYQKFTNNMYNMDEPVIEDTKSTPYTQIKFSPDLKRFGLKELTDDMISLLRKRVIDLAVCTNGDVSVYLDDELIKVDTLEDYINLYYETTMPVIYEKMNERWRVGVVYDPSAGFGQVSFVNGILTYQGGTHVNYVTDQIVDGLMNIIKEKHKKLNIKNAYIKDNLTVFVDCVIEDPGFSSQTKEFLTTKTTSFGSECNIGSGFIQKIAATGIIDEVVEFATLRDMAALKKSDGKKVQSIRGLPKLEDAKWAGTKKSKYCKLILTEGDSAKVFAMNGLEEIGNEKYGVFPLKGKLLNVRDSAPQKLAKNEEIANIKQILGLKQGKKYDDLSKLRYGGILILTDSDVDGLHIKGLVMNFIQFFWPSLIKRKGFIQSMATPIIKATKKTDTKKQNPKIFYTVSEYNKWVENDMKGVTDGWTIKYYKGLGTSDDKEAKAAFKNFEDKVISYTWDNFVENIGGDEATKEETTKDKQKGSGKDKDNDNEDDETETSNGDDDDDFMESDKNSRCYNAMTLAFSKNRTHDRKILLKTYNKDLAVTGNTQEIPYYEFIHKELIHYMNDDNIRMIPSECDGLKPVQRKLLFAAFNKKIDKHEIKVAQLAAYTSETTGYHHGEASLQGAIVNMAQTFPGANNINLLTPNGNFGTRRLGGKDAASARYIFTQLNELTPKIYRKEDEPVLKSTYEEGEKVEPAWYLPILPMSLVNEVDGIGYGYSTKVPSFNPLDIVDNLYRIMKGKEPEDMIPWYRGFKGKVTDNEDGTYNTRGIYEVINEDTVRITELPVGTWTQNYKDFLESLIVSPKNPSKVQILTSYDNNSGNNTIDFTLKFHGDSLQKLLKDKKTPIDKKLKLVGSLNATNMHLHNSEGVITKYTGISNILTDFYKFRLKMYGFRKEYYAKYLQNQLAILKYKRMFIEKVVTNEIIVNKRKKEDVMKDLERFKFPKLSTDINALEEAKTYRYVTDMSLFSLTDEKIVELDGEIQDKVKELELYQNTPVEDIWKMELEEFVKCYKKWLTDMENDDEKFDKAKLDKKSKNKGKGKNDTGKVKVNTR